MDKQAPHMQEPWSRLPVSQTGFHGHPGEALGLPPPADALTTKASSPWPKELWHINSMESFPGTGNQKPFLDFL